MGLPEGSPFFCPRRGIAAAQTNARAEVDHPELNGHTSLFHTVSSNDNRSEPILQLLIAAGASATIRVQAITWGAGFDWETTIFDVSPISYAQCGLIPQMHRDERQIYANLAKLMSAARRTVPVLRNVPNRYLQSTK